METIEQLLRPTAFEDLLVSEKVVKSLNGMYHRNRAINMIFYGPTGVGKTSAALIFAGENRLLFNAAELTLKEYRTAMAAGSTMTIDGRQRVMIFDEADRMATDIADQLPSDIEKHRYAAFILTTNRVDKLSQPIRSRCHAIDFNPDFKASDEIIERVLHRIEIKLNDARRKMHLHDLKAIILRSYPDMSQVANAIDFELLAA